MPNLAMHQLRTAAVAMQICETVNLDVDKENIIKACLVHDMGNIIKFNLNYFPELLKPEGLEYWQKVKYDFVLKYGNNEHKASLEIAREIGLSGSTINLIDCIDSSVDLVALDKDFTKKICLYSDNRVSPLGVVSAEEHSLDAKERYKNHPHAFDEEKRIFFMKNLFLIENEIFSRTNIKPEDINDHSIMSYVEKVIDFSI